jgi:uncharacterized protein YeaO (DUF488 family)
VSRGRLVQVRRIYESRQPDDGVRVLVDRIWPRGMTKDRADIDGWCKEVAPSADLRRWYSHDPDRFAEFEDRYRAELSAPVRAAALQHLRDLTQAGTVTLLTATREPSISEAQVLARLLR